MTKYEINKKTSECIATVTADSEVWQKYLMQAENKLLEKVSIKGFRKGKAPRPLALKHIAKSEIFSQAANKILNKLIEESTKNFPKGTIALDSPNSKIQNVNDKELIVQFIYSIYPQIEVGNYKNLGLSYVEKKVTSDIIAKEIQRVQKLKAVTIIKNGVIAKGDVVNLDFQGFIDGELFEGGSMQKFNLEIGSNKFIPGFEDALIGLKTNDKKDVAITFPDKYHDERFKGKPAIFKVVINSVKTKDLPEINDDFVKTLNISNVKTQSELSKYLKNLFSLQFQQEAKTKFQREIFEKILEKTKIVLPERIVNQEIETIKKDFEKNLQKQKMTTEQYHKLVKGDNNQLLQQFRLTAEKRLKDAFLFAELSKLEKIVINDEEYELEYDKLANLYNAKKEDLKKNITKPQLQHSMTNDRVIEKLIKYNAN